MSPLRQVRTLAVDYPNGHRVASHRHTWHQLVFARSGVVTVTTAHSAWLVPAHQAVWVPAEVEHGLSIRGLGSLRTLYFPPEHHGGRPECTVLEVGELLRAIILRCAALNIVEREQGVGQAALLDLLGTELLCAPTITLQLPLPTDARAADVARALIRDPGRRETIETLAAEAGASSRTIHRLFATQTSMTFGDWRTRLRMHEAMRRLSLQESVSEVAKAVGYDSLSAFVAAFRRRSGMTPGAYSRQSRDE